MIRYRLPHGSKVILVNSYIYTATDTLPPGEALASRKWNNHWWVIRSFITERDCVFSSDDVISHYNYNNCHYKIDGGETYFKSDVAVYIKEVYTGPRVHFILPENKYKVKLLVASSTQGLVVEN